MSNVMYCTDHSDAELVLVDKGANYALSCFKCAVHLPTGLMLIKNDYWANQFKVISENDFDIMKSKVI